MQCFVAESSTNWLWIIHTHFYPRKTKTFDTQPYRSLCVTNRSIMCRNCRILFAEILFTIATLLSLLRAIFYLQTEREDRAAEQAVPCKLSHAVSGTLLKYHFYELVFWGQIKTTKYSIEENWTSNYQVKHVNSNFNHTFYRNPYAYEKNRASDKHQT